MMEYEKSLGDMICSQGTQTRLSTADKNDHLVSFTSTCSLLSSTFNQFLLEVSKILRVPTDKQHHTMTVDKLISDFKEKSLLLNSIDSSELSFHSPLVPSSPPSIETTTPTASPVSLPVVPKAEKLAHEAPPDLSNRISPPPALGNIGFSSRSAFCKPGKLQSPPPTIKREPLPHQPSSHVIGHRHQAPVKSDSELLECLQKLQSCCDKYLPSATSLGPFSLSSLLPNLREPAPRTTAPTAQLPPYNDQRSDPVAFLKTMEECNPLLTSSPAPSSTPSRQSSPLFSIPMKCPYCDLTFHKKSHLSNHLVQLHSHSYHCCRQCKISFPDRETLEQHQQSHPKQQFQCTGCNLSFKTGSELKRHVKTHTQERAFMCDICGSRFNLKHNLKAHMRQHTGERPFRCKICNRGFTRSNNLKRHLYAHCGENNNTAAGGGGSGVQNTAAAVMSREQQQLLTMLPNVVMLESQRLHGLSGLIHNIAEVKVD